MLNFTYENKSEIIFGKNDENVLADALIKFGAKKVLLCYGKSSVKKSGLLDRIINSLSSKKIKYVEFGGISANPLKSDAIACAEFAKKNKVNFILAIGGGSVIDTAKFVAGAYFNKNMWNYYINSQTSGNLKKALPLGVVLTIPAAGSECSNGSVLRDEETGIKYDVMAECLRAKFAFVNPEYAMTLPKAQLANGASDILSHLMERYFSPLDNVLVSDKLLVAAMQGVIEISPKLLKDFTNYDYWAELCQFGLLAHNGMLDMGRGVQDWATHVIENKLISGKFNVAHGTGLAIIFPAWLKVVSKKFPDRILEFSTKVLGAEGKTKEQKIANGIKKLEDFYKKLGLPTTLKQIKLKAEDVAKLASEYFPQDIILGGYGKLTFDEILKVIETAK